ncbi:hypothetical protein EXIGLDRAFT_759453 [Exidia glandulosa HHB12029]|uniref:G domain-containing protein n=1 Tax=Exidia glandulosa HHB12029 TaxID=1314781 RepID=A0A165PVW2_EXIGL|nr:hypothetical protein EXIGLDRAFT_759453 [Exidia glandulosa HHB12029]
MSPSPRLTRRRALIERAHAQRSSERKDRPNSLRRKPTPAPPPVEDWDMESLSSLSDDSLSNEYDELADHCGTQTVDRDAPMIKDEDDEALSGNMSSAGRIVASINQVIKTLSPIAARKAVAWKENLRAVATEVTRPAKTIIAVIGATGAGKSSLINALLGDHIVPTDGMQCTTFVSEVRSTPIEISYHEQELVIATIEFISAESWSKEISHLLSALQDPDVDGSTAKLQAVDDGQQAWDRVRVVYPTLREDALAYYSTEQIIQSDPEIAAMLGNTVVFSSTAENFKTELQEFTGTRNGQVDLWPLVARVRIQCDAAVLKDNTTLVDLPGVGDSNTARSAIYHNYLRTADHIFVVAQIKRAATDLVARDQHTSRLADSSTTPAVRRKLTHKRRELDQLELSSLTLDTGRQLFCAEKRTEWVTEQIQGQFRAGIAALRGESANEHRDDEGDISVFCVSSNDFMKLVGKSPYDGRAAVFQTTDETCIPALVQYARGIGVAGIRAANQQGCPRYFKRYRFGPSQSRAEAGTIERAYGTLGRCCRSPKMGFTLTIRKRLHRSAYALLDVGTLTSVVIVGMLQVIRKAAREAGSKLLRDVDTLLIPKMTAAAKKAENAASERLYQLGQNIRSWPTLKAIFRRAGCWKHHDWNSVAVELMSRHFAASWQTTLKAKSMQDDARLVGHAVEQALAHVEQAAADSLKVLVSEHKAQAVKYVHTTTRLAIQECVEAIRDEQRDISRGMAARVAAELETLYKRCWSQSARGAKARALQLLREGIEEVKYDLFTSVVEDTSAALRRMLRKQLDLHYTKLAGMATSIEQRMSPIWDNTKPNAAFSQARTSAQAMLAGIETAIEELGYEA